MKTTNLFPFCLLMAALIALTLGACKKDSPQDQPDTAPMLQTLADNRLMSAIVDDAARDADKIMNAGSKGVEWVPCNATLDSTFTIADTIVYIVTYNGLNCPGNFFREGVIEVRKHSNALWADSGTAVYVKYQNVKFTRVSSGKWAFVNGTKVFTNASGGRLSQLGISLTSVVHTVSGMLTATFDDNSQWGWNISRTKTFTGSAGNLNCSYEGTGVSGGFTGLESWGTNRQGNLYYNSITSPVTARESCGWNLVSGSGIISIPAESLTAALTFGYDSNNQPVTGNACPTHVKVDWVKGNNSGTLYVQM